MGEKEIKPASTAGYDRGGVRIATDPNAPPPAGGARTVERPGTGGPVKQAPKDPGTKKGWSGSDTYPDGYRMWRDERGEIHLDNPDGTKANWDPDIEAWTGADGRAMPEDWSGGHQPGQHPNPPPSKP